MIDSLTIFSKGGLILYQYNAPHETPEGTAHKLNTFISTILLDPSAHGTAATAQKSVVILENQIMVEWQDQKDCMVVALYPKVWARTHNSSTSNNNATTTHAGTIPVLLQSVLHEFTLFRKNTDQDATLFDKTFHVLLKQAMSSRKQDVATKDTAANSTTATSTAATTKSHNHVKKGKEKRTWHDGNAKVTKEAMADLDYSKEQHSDGMDPLISEHSAALAEARAAYLPSPDEVPEWEEEPEQEDETTKSIWTSSLSFFSPLIGNSVITKEMLLVPLADMQRLLTSKNVANDLAQQICNAVQTTLVGKRLSSFSRVQTAVRQALETAIAKALQPPKHRQVNLLRSVVSKRDSYFVTKKTPYVIVMVGINGVGKSTSLAKIAYYLKSNGANPLLAACDTFRSGAIEQLNVHAKCLDVPLFHKGYAKDPSAVAKEAIAFATEHKHDVVLIDTAGRMQNNVPLMKALSKLVVENSPDLVLFVCEALVGNDGMDQLTMFNKALTSGGHTRQMDGIVLTKFDTVSDKVGAALTMTHVTGAPVVFVGTGQKYNHLKPLSVQSVIKSLFL